MTDLKIKTFTAIDGTQYRDIVNEYETIGINITKQKIDNILNIIKGEWTPNVDVGLPMESIRQNGNNPDIVAQLYVTEILTVPHVVNVDIPVSNYDDSRRIYSADFVITTDFGATITTSI